jgi:hypothetical protein
MRRASFLALCAGVMVFAVVAPARSECPFSPIGVTATTDATGRLFFATDKAAPLADTDESDQLAVAEARVSARAMLMKDKDVPKANNGRLRGVRDVNICSANASVFVTVRLSEADIRRANALDDALRQSFQHTPTPHQH